MLNRIILIGRLTRDPEMRTVGEHTVANFSLAVDRPFANQQGQREADFIDCVAWRKLGETVGNHLTKGRLVAVEGRLQIRSYEASDGSKRRAAEVVCDAVRFLDRAKGAEGAASNEPMDDGDALPDDLPF